MKRNMYATKQVGNTNIVCEGYSRGVDVTVLIDNRGDVIVYIGGQTIRTDREGAYELSAMLNNAAKEASRRNEFSIEDEQVVSSLEIDTTHPSPTPPGNDPVDW